MNRLEIGTRIDGKYEVLGRLRAGGMGEVYRVRHLHLNETRVIKVLRADLKARPEAAERFHREARLATQVKHPRVATLHDYSRFPDGSFYMVWEYIEGQDVASWLQEKGVFPVPIAVELGIQALSGLEAIHHAGIIHRDLSPDNLMITSDSRGRLGIKIIDLGLAKGVSEDSLFDSQEGGFGGKLNYCSPEHVGLIEGVRPDQLSDLYSFAIVLYKMICGELPFPELAPGVSLAERFESPPMPLVGRNPEVEVPPELEAVLHKALAFEREQRYPAATALREAIEALHLLPRREREAVRGQREGAEEVIAELQRRVEQAESQRRQFQTMQARELLDQYLASGQLALARLSLETLLELDPEYAERAELEERIERLGNVQHEHDSVQALAAEVRRALDAGELEQAREKAKALETRDPKIAERLRRDIDLAEEQRQLDDQAAFHRGRLDRFLTDERLHDAEVELGLLEGLDLPRVVVDLYRRRIAELRKQQEERARLEELERTCMAAMAAREFSRARSLALELEQLAPGHARAAALLQEADRREAQEQRRRSLDEGVRVAQQLLAAGDLDQAELAIKVLERLAPEDASVQLLGRELAARRAQTRRES